MTVKELIEVLRELPEDYEVVLQKDPEGNGYCPCAGAESGMYIPDEGCRDHSGEFIDQGCYESNKQYYSDMGFEIDEFVENSVVIFPG